MSVTGGDHSHPCISLHDNNSDKDVENTDLFSRRIQDNQWKLEFNVQSSQVNGIDIQLKQM